MKHKLLLALGTAVIALAGCTADVEVITPDAPTPEEAITININGSIDQTYTTRVDDGGFCEGDQVGLYGVNYTEGNTLAGTLLDEGNQVDNARYTYDGSAWSSRGNIYYKDAETNIDLYAYYPYANPESVSAYEFEVAADQSGEGIEDGYAASDFLWAKAENVTPSEAKVTLHFSHRLSSVNVNLVEGDGWAEGEFEAASKSVLVMNTVRTAEIDLATGEATAVGDVELEGIVMKHNAEGFRAIVVPQSVEAGKSLFTITVNGINYRYRNSDADRNYEAGKQTNFTITVKKKEHSGELEFTLVETTITDWVADLDTHGGEARQYYVVHLDTPGTLESTILADGKNPAKIKNLKISGRISGADFDFMRDRMTILQSVNLKESEIVKCWRCLIRFEGDSEFHYEYFYGEKPEGYHACELMLYERAESLGKTIQNLYGLNDGYYTLDYEIPEGAFHNKISIVNFVFPEKVVKIGAEAFSGTLLSGALIIPDDVIEIGGGAFSGTSISTLTLPTNLIVIGGGAFYGCSSLSGSLALPGSLEEIGGQAFEGCSMLNGTLTLSPKLTEIPIHCFDSCSFTGDLAIPEGVKTIDYRAFMGCRFNGQLSLCSTLESIGDEVFYYGPQFQGELIIPKSLLQIGAYSFVGNNFSSIIFEENSELIRLGNGAFYGNWRISEPVILPEGLTTIGSSTFRECTNVPQIVIPSTVTTIGSGAFMGCYYITKLQCNATMPPICGSGVFDGVAKDNFVVEVPEQSVSLYQTANGWSDFKRIGAYYDFSISRKHLRVLNAEHSETYLLRVPAGEPWSVESCPEWVTVTPSSGVGRTEVVITVGEMARTEETFTTEWMDTWGNWHTDTYTGRAGEIQFLLDNKERRVTMEIEQYDSDRYDGEVIVNQTATVGGGVNIVFMGDCFDARDIDSGAYLEGINEAIGYYFAIEPYKSYRDYFNVYTVVGMSLDSGIGTVNTIKDAKFGSQYSLYGIVPDTQTTYDYAMLCETVNADNLNETLVVMIENTTDYGGICYMWGDGSAIAICPMSRDAYPFDFRGIVQHEAGGHGFGKLGDEYIYHNQFATHCPWCGDVTKDVRAAHDNGWYRNLSITGDYNTVAWAHLFAHPDYMNIVDMYEGAYMHTRFIWRSEANSCMNNNVPYYSAISRQEMVERIMRYADLEFSLEEFYARDVRDASNNDFVTTPSALSAEMTPAQQHSASKQMPPRFMGERPVLE